MCYKILLGKRGIREWHHWNGLIRVLRASITLDTTDGFPCTKTILLSNSTAVKSLQNVFGPKRLKSTGMCQWCSIKSYCMSSSVIGGIMGFFSQIASSRRMLLGNSY